MSGVDIDFWIDTDVGPTREHNEDGFAWLAPDQTGGHGYVFVVADGMGGAAAGEVASDIVLRTVESRYPAPLMAEGVAPLEALRRLLEEANQAIFQTAQADATKKGHGLDRHRHGGSRREPRYSPMSATAAPTRSWTATSSASPATTPRCSGSSTKAF